MKAPEELVVLLGSRGIDTAHRVVVYDAGGLEAPFLAFALQRLGHKNVAVLNGGVDAWTKEAKLPLVAGDALPVPAGNFVAVPDGSLIMNNRQTVAAMEESGTVVLDVRPVVQYLGLQKHPLAVQAGHIDRTVNLSVQGLWTVEGFLKDAKAISWLLESRGITKDKKVIVTCNTGQQAAGAWFALTYLGYPNVAVHDGSWVSWERSPMMKK